MTELLVSVRSVAEAEAAVAGGAGLIDVKEPLNGPLGRAEAKVIRSICEFVRGRRPVSAALGELKDGPAVVPSSSLAFAKVGLAHCGSVSRWREKLSEFAAKQQAADPDCHMVAVSYVDWRLAAAPPPTEVCAFAIERNFAAVLMDTWSKDGRTLVDWLEPIQIVQLCRACHERGVKVALAGSIGPLQVEQIWEAAPDWIAVRGFVCRGANRTREVDEHRVRELAEFIREMGRENEAFLHPSRTPISESGGQPALVRKPGANPSPLEGPSI